MAAAGDRANEARVPAIWRGLAALVALLVLALDLNAGWKRLTLDAGTGSVGFFADRCNADQFCTMARFTPQSPAGAAGIVSGDLIRYDNPLDNIRTLRPEESVGLTVRHSGGGDRHVVLTAVPTLPGPPAQQRERRTSGGLAGLLVLASATGLFLILRSRRWPVVLIGTAIACSSLPNIGLPIWLSAPALAPFAQIAIFAVFFAYPLLYFAFARRFRFEASGRDGPILRWAWRGLAVVVAVNGSLFAGASLLDLPVPFGGSGLGPIVVLESVGLVLTFITLWIGRRESLPEERSRYALLLVALSLTMLSGVFALIANMTGDDTNLGSPLAVGYYAAPFLGLLLFAYAVLRHRVIDIGFAVNKTLVYGVVSFIVLLLFGLAKWGIEKVMPEAWRAHLEANAFISAGIALAIFLVFHRIRDGVEHVIEGVFFHKWRQNEAQLERFVRQAPHMLKPATLKAATVVEFVRFSGGAEVAFYSARNTGTEAAGFGRDAGAIAGLDATLDGDLLPLVALRAEGKPLSDEAAAPLQAALVLPMIQRNELTGFIALGAKPSGDAWRPDERTALGQAAHQIGLDLHALRIEELEAKVNDLEAGLRHTDRQLRLALTVHNG